MAKEHEQEIWKAHGETTEGRPSLYDEDAQGNLVDSPRGDDSVVQSFHDFAVEHYRSLNILGEASLDVDDDELLYDALMQRGSDGRQA